MCTSEESRIGEGHIERVRVNQQHCVAHMEEDKKITPVRHS